MVDSRKYDNSDFAVVRDMIRLSILGRQQAFACNGIQSARTTAQVASFESPPVEPRREKTGLRIFDQVRHKLDFTSSEES